MLLPLNPLDLNIVVLCGGNQARLWTMKERLKDFHNVDYFDNVGYTVNDGHQRILEHARSSNLEYVFIFEDDACLMRAFFEIYPNIVEQCGKLSYDLLYFGANLLTSPARQLAKNIYEPKPLSLYMTHAYIVPQIAYDQVIEAIVKDKHRYVVDDVYTRSSLMCLFVVPPLVTQLPPECDLEKSLFLHDIMMLGFKQHI